MGCRLVCCVWLLGAACAAPPAAPPRIGAAAAIADTVALPIPDAPATVLLFVEVDCPIANAYGPELARIVHDFRPRRVAFRLVYPDADTDAAAAAAHAARLGIRCPVVVDPHHAWVRHVGARFVPEAAVLRADGTLAYCGRIDDTWAAYQRRRPAPTRRELRTAIAAVLDGGAVPAGVPPVGCPIAEPLGP